MGRPRKSEHTREQLLEQGIELLTEHGYHGTGLKTILDTVQVPKGSFYNYFESKEKYVAEIIEHYNRNIIRQLDDYLDTTEDDPVTVLRNVHEVIILELEKQGLKGCLVGNLAAEIGNSSQVCQQNMQLAFQAWKDRFIKLMTDGQDQGLIRSDLPAETLTDIFWSTWQGGLLRMKIDGGTDHLTEIIHVMLDVLLKK